MRNARALITAAPLPPLENCVEVMIADARLAFEVFGRGEVVRAEEAQMMAVLVSFDPTDAQRRATRAMAITQCYARYTFEQAPLGQSWNNWLIGLLQQSTAAVIGMVFALPEHTQNIESNICSFCEDLKNAKHHYVDVSIAVAEHPLQWSKLTGIDGFVRSASHGGSDALTTFEFVAALMSPTLYYCVDSEDLRQVLGTAELPSRVEMLCRDGDEMEQAADLLQDAVAVAINVTSLLTVSQVRSLVAKIRTALGPAGSLHPLAPAGTGTSSTRGQICLLVRR